MLYLFSGTDREKVRAALDAAVGKVEKKGIEVVRITDAHSVADLEGVLQGSGLFATERILVLDGLFGGGNTEMRERAEKALLSMRDAKEVFFMSEGKLDAATRKLIEKYAEKSEKFDAPKKEEDKTIFTLANALQKGDKKALWVGYQRELAKGSAPEQIQGILFWGAKRALQFARSPQEKVRARKLIMMLAELPHLARRRGEDMEYALERFVLAIA